MEREIQRLDGHAGLLGGTTSIHEGLLALTELVRPRTHGNEDHCLYVVSGTVHLQIGDQFIKRPRAAT